MAGCLELAKHTTEAAAKREHSTIQMDLRPFLCFCNVTTLIVPNFVHLVAPLNKTLRKDQPGYVNLLYEEERAAVAS